MHECIKMSYYWFNKQEILQKAKHRYFKKEAAKFYLKIKTCQRKEKIRLKSIKEKDISN